MAVDLNAVREALAKATPGDWEDVDNAVIISGSGASIGYPPANGAIASLMDGEYIENGNAKNDANLIASALGDNGWLRAMADELEALLAEKTAQDAVVARLREALDHIVKYDRSRVISIGALVLGEVQNIARAALANSASGESTNAQ